MRFEWDDRKNESNLKKHGVDFVLASRVFDDPYCVTEIDRIEDGELRLRTVGEIDGEYLLLVIHLLDTDGEEFEEAVRIISARKAERQERRRYERGFQT